MIDPNEYLIVQDRLFASFSAVDPGLLAVCAVVVVAVFAWVWHVRRDLDVVALGQPHGDRPGRGPPRRWCSRCSPPARCSSPSPRPWSGPITFFGLLVANVAYLVMGTHRHTYLLPGAALLGVITLVGGQSILEHVFGMDTVLSVIVEFVGGIVFIMLLIRGGKR